MAEHYGRRNVFGRKTKKCENFGTTDKDKGDEDDAKYGIPAQSQAFGLADLFQDGGELGYISIAELKKNNVEMDFHWKPKTIKEIRNERE